MTISLRRIEIALAAAVLVCGLALALSLLGRGAWLDEFWTLASTPRAQSPAEFWAMMTRDVHPPLHYGLIQVAHWVGIEDIWALRALNLLGLPLTAWAGWLAHQRGALNVSQASVLIALFAASPMFLDRFPEIRGYALIFCASIASALIAYTLLRARDEDKPWDRTLLIAWGVCLLVFVSLHYFALLMGGVLTLMLMAARGGKGVIPLALVSAAAAAPTLITFASQIKDWNSGIVSWVLTGKVDAIFVMFDQAFAASAFNLAALGCAIAAVLIAFERGAGLRALSSEAWLAGAIAAFAGILVAVNAVHPVVIDRYLVAGGGVVAVLMALLAGSQWAPRWSAAAACVFALLSLGRSAYSGVYDKPGWSESAQAVAELSADCPTTRVFMDPSGDTPELAMYAASRRYGQMHYASRLGFDAQEVEPGDALPAGGACPTVLWLEFGTAPGDADARVMLKNMGVALSDGVEVRRVGSGLLVISR